ncbi:transcriptional regulator [Tersicoccus solisilvae]|uniref:Transcriptional regulator n=1 Tax=Tersicoccus solisilvae TaxID=1882339 RepID=A0ABQ1P4A7_9MICC|nr:transcriptional regulator [Tersicoccus solisilvae]
MEDRDARRSETDAVGVSFQTLTRMIGASGHADPDRLVAVAARLMPHADQAGVTSIRNDRPAVTVASTGEIPRAVDALQYRTGEGPCLDASLDDEAVISDDLAVERRWPAFAAACVDQFGVRSMLSVRLSLSQQDRAALNFYSPSTHVFTGQDVAEAVILAPFAALVVQQRLHEKDVSHYQEALISSRRIGSAVGILMAQHGVDADDAFGMLRTASQHLNRKLKDLAADVNYTGDLP